MTLWSHGLYLARLPCPSLYPGVCANSCPLRWWCYLTMSSSVTPFSSCFQSFPSSGCFPKRWLFTSGGQSIGVSFSFSIIPSKEYSGLISFRIDRFDLLVFQGALKSLLQLHSSKAWKIYCTKWIELAGALCSLPLGRLYRNYVCHVYYGSL